MSSWNGLSDYTEATRTEFGDLNKTSHHILDTIELLFEQAGVPLPDRRYVATGPTGSVAYDCEQLTVTAGQIYLGTPGDPSLQPNGCPLLMSGDFLVELVRCYPIAQPTKRNPDKIQAPSVTTMNQAAEVQKIDAQLLLESAYTIQSTQGVIAQVTFGAPQGTFQAILLSISCSLSRD